MIGAAMLTRCFQNGITSGQRCDSWLLSSDGGPLQCLSAAVLLPAVLPSLPDAPALPLCDCHVLRHHASHPERWLESCMWATKFRLSLAPAAVSSVCTSSDGEGEELGR